jgi:hypothetical protein
MARSQAAIVHDEVAYDLEVDTTHATAAECAAVIAAAVAVSLGSLRFRPDPNLPHLLSLGRHPPMYVACQGTCRGRHESPTPANVGR